jgi:hypothetical protein
MLKYPMAEVYDRFTIEKLKCERIESHSSDYFNILRTEIYTNNYFNTKCQGLLDGLYEVNGKIWDLESDIRRGKENELGLEEVGRRALEIRNLNAHRILLKNEVAKLFNEIAERKYQHASETGTVG